jgi:aspartate/methionine/tyrosine aminotransferase
MPLSRRIESIEPFLAMDIKERADRLERAGRDVIHLEIGEPDFAAPPAVLRAAQRALSERPMRYTPALGLPELRQAISDFYERTHGLDVSAERIIVTAGSSAALLAALGAVLDVGDELLVADPSYPCNRHLAHSLGAVARTVPVGPESAYQLDAEHVRAHAGPRTRAVLVASPSNPTGTLLSEGQLAALKNACDERGAALIVDEIYQGLVYAGPSRTALELSNQLFVVNSFSKFFQMTGFRLGWLVAPAAYVRPLEKLIQNLFIAPSTLAQWAALAALEPETLTLLEERRRELDQRRRYLLGALPRLGFGIPAEPEGAFYVYADTSRLGADSTQLAADFLEQAGVATTPGRDFGLHRAESHLRIAYTQPLGRLQEAAERLAHVLGRRA